MQHAFESVGCPVCGSDASIEVADRIAIQDEVVALWDFHTRRMQPTSDPRDLTDRLAFSQDPPIRVARCTVCTHIFRNPRERGVTTLYSGEDVDDATLESLFRAQVTTFKRQLGRLADVHAGRTSGLEIGSYVGAFLAAARQAGWQFEGCDVNDRAVEFARAKGLNVTAGTLDDIAAQRATNPHFDVIAIWNCFEQLADVRATMRTARDLLHDGGVLTIRVPNAEYWLKLRAHLNGPLGILVRGALAQNNLLSFPYRNGFTPQSLRILCARNGFDVVRSYSEFSLPVSAAGTPWWAAVEGRLLHRAVRALRSAAGAPWIEVYARKNAVA